MIKGRKLLINDYILKFAHGVDLYNIVTLFISVAIILIIIATLISLCSSGEGYFVTGLISLFLGILSLIIGMIVIPQMNNTVTAIPKDKTIKTTIVSNDNKKIEYRNSHDKVIETFKYSNKKWLPKDSN